ncbi:universal stress protein [Halalkalicoccus jeotgali]|uniref:UspA domain protein n=1 Tax=Halalkalicoccus jeotgali (strain DSM 18796 / CECT 7217 / JCM 14584 / KCTC 4019 / B3) TaxID=795797 RepID=D8J4U0_HALJB|nr:universal stress protein [Halalkalicoccus jeotgali]ADJ15557.1 UspA domain protein [Halalkalicoccus jeotgali B3]ELY36034.1 UspA domain-containing protein [Halalkalicoccus jeotgali B3]
MTDRTVESVLLPLANEDDARQTATALRRYLPSGTTVHALHVIEHTEGGIDPASPSQLEAEAQETFSTLREHLEGTSYDLHQEVRYGTDLVETVFEAAEDLDVTYIVFQPRPSNRLVDLLSGDTARKLITETTRPVLVLPPERT